METAQARLERLRYLIGEAGKNYFERISLCTELLADKHWLASEWNGDDYKAAQMLEEEFLYDLSGSMTIFDLLRIKQHFSAEKDWKSQRYNLRKLLAACKPEPAPRQTRTVISKSEYEEVAQKAKELEFTVKQERKQRVIFQERAEKLEQEVKTLEKENARLRGRVEELERILQRKFDKVLA